ncbi:MAG: DUF4157 domain-containing protein [Deltaproteobacteria bacterium]|nr:DUF4157 domain-containing protein [Deltaproteobacteria bacterium]
MAFGDYSAVPPPIQCKLGMADGGAGGGAFDGPLRAGMEQVFATDFSSVTVTRDAPSATALGAIAYTQGEHIAIGPGTPSLESASGRALLGHELAHVVQQRAGRVAASERAPINAEPALEVEADAAGERAARGVAAAMPGAGATARASDRAPVQRMKIAGAPDGKDSKVLSLTEIEELLDRGQPLNPYERTALSLRCQQFRGIDEDAALALIHRLVKLGSAAPAGAAGGGAAGGAAAAAAAVSAVDMDPPAMPTATAAVATATAMDTASGAANPMATPLANPMASPLATGVARPADPVPIASAVGSASGAALAPPMSVAVDQSGAAAAAPASAAAAKAPIKGTMDVFETPAQYLTRTGKHLLYRAVRMDGTSKKVFSGAGSTSSADGGSVGVAPDGNLFAGIPQKEREARYRALAAWPADHPITAAAPQATADPLVQISGSNYATQYISTGAAIHGAAHNTVRSWNSPGAPGDRPIRRPQSWAPVITIDVRRLAPQTRVYDTQRPDVNYMYREDALGMMAGLSAADAEVLLTGEIPAAAIVGIMTQPSAIAEAAQVTIAELLRKFDREVLVKHGLIEADGKAMDDDESASPPPSAAAASGAAAPPKGAAAAAAASADDDDDDDEGGAMRRIAMIRAKQQSRRGGGGGGRGGGSGSRGRGGGGGGGGGGATDD